MHNSSDVAKPLCELTKKDTKFTWMSEHNEAFNKVKQLLISSAVRAHFD